MASVLISAAAAFGVALGTLWLARKSGLTEVQVAYRNEAAHLVEALRERVTILETENAQLRAEVAMLERRYERLEEEYEALKRRVDA